VVEGAAGGIAGGEKFLKAENDEAGRATGGADGALKAGTGWAAGGPTMKEENRGDC